MSDSEFKSFNDPALRAAVRRVWSDERAPQELRQQILAYETDLLEYDDLFEGSVVVERKVA